MKNRRPSLHRHKGTTLRTLSAPIDMGCVLSAHAEPYRMIKTPDPMTIDAVMSEPSWKSAPSIPLYTPVTHDQPVSHTDARMVWSDTHLYVFFDAADQDVRATFTEHDSPLWRQDVVEIFIKPDPEDPAYYEINISPLGVVYDARIALRGTHPYTVWSQWHAEGIEVATKIEGCVNNPRVPDTGYRVEVAIPFSALSETRDQRPRAGDRWRFNLARYDYSAYLPSGKELSASSRLTQVDFHRHEEWRELEFVDAPTEGSP